MCLIIFVAFAALDAGPVPQRQPDDIELNGPNLGVDDTNLEIPKRNGRQYNFNDYPFSSYQYDFFKSPAYSDYYNSFYDPSYFAPQPNRRPQINGYPSKKKSQRRKGFPFGPTTQKYTIWDLARK